LAIFAALCENSANRRFRSISAAKYYPDTTRIGKPTLNAIHVSPAGDALSWPALHVDVYVLGLVELAFGKRLFGVAAGRRTRARTLKVHAAAAKISRAKGEGPRKT
jgi:hypothetical protein